MRLDLIEVIVPLTFCPHQLPGNPSQVVFLINLCINDQRFTSSVATSWKMWIQYVSFTNKLWVSLVVFCVCFFQRFHNYDFVYFIFSRFTLNMYFTHYIFLTYSFSISVISKYLYVVFCYRKQMYNFNQYNLFFSCKYLLFNVTVILRFAMNDLCLLLLN